MTAGNGTVKVKTFSLSLSTQYGPLPPLSVDIPDLPMRLSELVPLMQAVCDTMVSQAGANVDTKETVTCGKGCNSCCRHVVPVSIPEAMLLMEHVESMEENRRKAVVSRLSAALNACRRGDLLDALLTAPSDDAAMGAAQEYFNRSIACPFLEEGACSIYSVRPFACREFNATTPPQWCENPFVNKVRHIPIAPKITTIMARFAANALHERMVVLPMIMIASEDMDVPSWHTPFQGIGLFETLMGCFTNPSESTPE
jgi:Fe-S-cluster containining protein